MDIGEIDRNAFGKRLLENVDQFQEKVSKENAALVKLQVDQDSAFWEQQEQLAQCNSDRERLQQNILELQMQREDLESQYQQELRRRAEVLDKVKTLREMCGALEGLAEKCKEGLARAAADRAVLSAASERADSVVRACQQKHADVVKQAGRRIKTLEDQLQEMREQQGHMTGVCQATQLQLQQLHSQLQAERARGDQLRAANNDANGKLVTAETELEKKAATISSLQNEINKMADEIHSALAEKKDVLDKKDKELKNAVEELESLKQALRIQEELTKTQCERNGELQQTLARTEEQRQLAETANKAYKLQLEEITITFENLNDNIAKLKNENDALAKELKHKQQLTNRYDKELESVKQQLSVYVNKFDEVTSELRNTTEESQNKTAIIEKIEAENGVLVKILADNETAFKNYRKTTEGKLKSQAEIIEEKCNELEVKISALNQQKEAHNKLVVELANVTAALKERDHEIEVKTSAIAQEKKAHDKLEIELAKIGAVLKEREHELEVKISEMAQEKEAHAKLVDELAKVISALKERDHELEVKTAAIIMEQEARAKQEADVLEMKKNWEIESETMREKLMAKISQLEAAIREKEKSAKDEEINSSETRIPSIMTVASKALYETPRFSAESDTNAREDSKFCPRHDSSDYFTDPDVDGIRPKPQRTEYNYSKEPQRQAEVQAPVEVRHFACFGRPARPRAVESPLAHRADATPLPRKRARLESPVHGRTAVPVPVRFRPHTEIPAIKERRTYLQNKPS